MGDRFITQSEIDEQRRKRQEEWERVRKPHDPKEAPEPETAPKGLYEQLKANRDKQEAEEAEARRLSNMVRGLDNEEFEFFDKVAKAKRDEEESKRREEERLFEEMRQRDAVTIESAGTSGPNSKSAQKRKVSDKAVSKQAQMLSGLIKRSKPGKLSSSNDGGAEEVIAESNTTINNKNDTTKTEAVRLTAVTVIGKRPTGIVAYGDDSDDETRRPHFASDSGASSSDSASDTDSDQSRDENFLTLPHKSTGVKEGSQDASKSRSASTKTPRCSIDSSKAPSDV